MINTLNFNSWSESRKLLERALRSIPIASQTFSKSHLQLPKDNAPLFISHGKGSRIWDVDGNQYVDLLMGLGAVTLGYCDGDVNAAISAQLEKGTVFSLPSTLEMQLAEKIIELVPSAEMVRFGKAGSDATSGAVRLARHHTGREQVIACGYHGWHDWYIGSTTRNSGVPSEVCGLTHPAPFNDLDYVETCFTKQPDKIAAVILEPVSVTEPKPGYLSGLKKLCEKHGALLIFDEVVTGFRYSLGGAQEYYGVTPHLTALGKGMANGMPVSAVVGPKYLMQGMEEIFFSGTFGGECLSIAACIATLIKMENQNVPQNFWNVGGRLQRKLYGKITRFKLDDVLSIAGTECNGFILCKDTASIPAATIETFLIGELLSHGIFSLGSLVMNNSFGDREIDITVSAFSIFCEKLSAGIESGTLADVMEYPPIEPIFKVRQSR